MTIESPEREEIKAQWRARLEDALSPSARAKRRLLLVTSTITYLILILGLFPTKIEALGIAFESKNQRDLLLLLAAVNGYALLGFLLYAWADMQLQRRIQRNANTGYLNEFVKGKATRMESTTYFLRFAFDFIVPIVYGTYALHQLYKVLAV